MHNTILCSISCAHDWLCFVWCLFGKRQMWITSLWIFEGLIVYICYHAFATRTLFVYYTGLCFPGNNHGIIVSTERIIMRFNSRNYGYWHRVLIEIFNAELYNFSCLGFYDWSFQFQQSFRQVFVFWRDPWQIYCWCHFRCLCKLWSQKILNSANKLL